MLAVLENPHKIRFNSLKLTFLYPYAFLCFQDIIGMHDFHLYAHTYTKRMHVHVCSNIMIEYELLRTVSSVKRLLPYSGNSVKCRGELITNAHT